MVVRDTEQGDCHNQLPEPRRGKEAFRVPAQKTLLERHSAAPPIVRHRLRCDAAAKYEIGKYTEVNITSCAIPGLKIAARSHTDRHASKDYNQRFCIIFKGCTPNHACRLVPVKWEKMIIDGIYLDARTKTLQMNLEFLWLSFFCKCIQVWGWLWDCCPRSWWGFYDQVLAPKRPRRVKPARTNITGACNTSVLKITFVVTTWPGV